MKKWTVACLLVLGVFSGRSLSASDGTDSWVRINQVGYLPQSIKVAVFLSEQECRETEFSVCDASDGQVVLTGQGRPANGDRWGMKCAMRLDFSELCREGTYYVTCGAAQSPCFRVASTVYDGATDFLLHYMRQQRCGYNPYLDTVCHQHDGYIVDHPTRSGERIDVRGGWHDASDYLQYLTTSANATYQMLFAWRMNPDTTVFKDRYDASGRPGANGVPDVLDEARWGLEWLMRMNPDSAVMFNQIADDRDHAGMRIPSQDRVDYGWGAGTGRPVYYITGRPQGPKHKNRTSGVASSAAKFASAFALGAEVFRGISPDWADSLRAKVSSAYAYAEALPGNTQTVCVVSPYFYEEDNYVDDIELAAATRYALSGDAEWLKRADYWGQLEEVTPWMELGRARHYQFYPFVNLGHYYLAASDDEAMREKYRTFMRRGLEQICRRAAEQDDPFLNGIPFIWCSNNLVAAALTQARLYHQVSGDTTFLEMEAALRDWLFGCNPWGTSMICGYPEGGDYPTQAHSAYVRYLNDIPRGGLVDGPIYRQTYESLIGIHLTKEDEYAPFQHGEAVYHDDQGDYSSNEPTMDGTASLCFYLSSMERAGKLFAGSETDQKDATGATIRRRTDRKVIYLIFSADERFEGASHILRTLDKQRIKGSFFLTGNCLRNRAFEEVIHRIVREGHYLGGHSDRHLLYATWGDRKPLVEADSLIADLKANRKELGRFGVDPMEANVFLPPYEHCTADNVRWIASQGLQTINLTPGIGTAEDYTTPDMENYRSSKELIERLFTYEAEHGLNGCILLIHPGTEDARRDKLYLHLDRIVSQLKKKGYSFERF